MAAVSYWLSQQPSYERPKWRSQRPATPPSFHLRMPDDRDLDAVTWTRATTKSVTDYQGNVHQALSGEVAWEGYRRVRNLFASSATLSTQGVTVEVGATYVISFYGTGSIAFSGGGSGSLAGTGAATRVYTTVTATTTTLTCTVTGSVTSAQCQRARPGQTTPDEYVSVGVLSTPYHGAKVDGVKYFATDDRGRLIDGTRGCDRDGTGAWVDSSSVTPVATGLSIGSAQTNRITYSSDLTSGWTLRGAATRTAAYDAQVGVYTQLRSVGASGVDDIFASASGFTAASRTEPAFMLRAVSTSGTVVLHDTVSGSWSINLALVSTTRFERIDRFHPAVTISGEHYSDGSGNGGLWFYASSGALNFDVSLITKVDAQRVQSLIYSAGSVTTKNADYPIAVLPTGNANTIVADYTYHAPTGVAEAGVFAANNSGSSDMLDARAEACYGVAGVGGVNQAVLSFNSAQKAGRFRVAVRGACDNFALIRTGNTLSTDVSGTAPAINQLQLGGLEKVTTYNLRGVLHSISVYPAALTDTQLQALSA